MRAGGTSQNESQEDGRPGVVFEGFGDTDETYSDLEDEPVPLEIEVLVLSCI